MNGSHLGALAIPFQSYNPALRGRIQDGAARWYRGSVADLLASFKGAQQLLSSLIQPLHAARKVGGCAGVARGELL